jgi:hypothetical protein
MAMQSNSSKGGYDYNSPIWNQQWHVLQLRYGTITNQLIFIGDYIVIVIAQINDDWAVGADSLQWTLLRHRKGPLPWYGVSFVSSTKDILARCMREKGIPAHEAELVLDDLPDTFTEWERGPSGLVIDDLAPALANGAIPGEIAATTE